MVALIALIVSLGLYSDARFNERHDNLIQQFRTEPEFIKTRALELPAEFQHTTTGKLPTTTTYWVAAETQDWLLLNGVRGTQTCDVLADFGQVNAPSEAMSLQSLFMIAAGFKGRPVELQVVVPRFKQRPSNLDRCVGFTYDQPTGQLKVGGKFVAYLHPAQPRLKD